MPLTDTQVTHLAISETMTACGLRGIQHRPLKYTRDGGKVSCRSCRKWLKP